MSMLDQRAASVDSEAWGDEESNVVRCMGRPRGRQTQSTRRSASNKLTRAMSSSSPPAPGPLSQPGLDSVRETITNGEQASIKAEPPRATRHRRAHSSIILSSHKNGVHTPEPVHMHGDGIDSRRAVDTVNAAVPSDGRSSRSGRWWWSKTRDTTDPAPGADSRVIEELLDSAEEEPAGLTGMTSPRDAKVRSKRYFSRWRSSKTGEQRQQDSRTEALSANVIAAAARDSDAAGDSKVLLVPERLLDSTDAASTTRSAGSSTPDARTANDGGPDSSRPSSRQSATAREDDGPRKSSRHRRGNSWLEFLGLAAKAGADVPGDSGQEAGGTGRLRSRRGEAPAKKTDAAGAGHRSTLSCFGMPHVADDEGGSSLDDGPLLIEGLTEGAIGMRNLCNTCFINSTLQCLRATPGLLRMLAPDLLADPSQLPSDLIEPLSSGPPALLLPEDAAEAEADPPAAEGEPAGPAEEGQDEAIPSPEPEPADAAAASASAQGAGADTAEVLLEPAQNAVGAAESAQEVEQLPAPAYDMVAAAGDAVEGTEPKVSVEQSCAGNEGSPEGKPAAAEAEACDADPSSAAAAAGPAAAGDGDGDRPDDPEADDAPAGTAQKAGADALHTAEQGEEEAAAAPEEAAVVPATKQEIARDLVQVMVQLAVGSGSDPVAPRQLYRDMAHNDMWAQFSDGGQHDSHELLRFVMSALHEVHDRVTEKPPYAELEDVPDEAPAAKAERLWQLLHAREASPVSDLFQGQLESRVTCNKCGSTFYTYEPFMDLSLSLFKEGKMAFFRGKTIDKLEDCFRVYTEEEKLEGNEAYFCPSCKARHSATKALRIHRFPHCLVLHIKRFKGLNRTHYKLSSNVTFPLLGLNLASFSTAGKAPGRGDRGAPASDGPGLYDLYAVSNHTGSLDSGHYTAYVKVADPENEGEQKWLLLADDKVSDAQADSIVSAEAYMLFYVQRAQAPTSEDE